jgi:hypothetical protein
MPDDLQTEDSSAGEAKKRQAVEMGVLALLVVAFLAVSLMEQKPFAQKTAEETMKAFGLIVAAGLTLVMFSFLYRDNPLFKIAENLYVGVALGYTAIMNWREGLKPLVYDPIFNAPTSGSLQDALLHRGIPILLGIMLLTRLSRKHGWISRYAYAVIIGWGAGVAIPAITHSYVLRQLEAAVVPLQEAVVQQATTAPAFSQAWFAGTAGPILGAMVAMIGTVAVLFYFFFSVEHKRVGRAVSTVGIWFLMVSFGASFGYTVMGRLSLLIGRVQFLLFEWLKIPSK